MTASAPPLVSGEGVRLDLLPAGVGSRMVAVAIDAAVQFGALVVLALVDGAVASGSDRAATIAVLIVELVAVVAAYPIVMEWTTKGRTVGKICIGLRVVRDDGGPIRFWQAVVRGLAGLVLEKPGLFAPISTAAGVLTVTSSAREKRIGDMLAGTVVLNERAVTQAAPMPIPWVPPHLAPWAAALDLQRLDDALALRLRLFATRAHAMSPAAQHHLGERLRGDLLASISPPPPPGTPTPALIMSVLAERRRRADPPWARWGQQQPGFAAPPPAVAPPGPTPPGPTPPGPRPPAPAEPGARPSPSRPDGPPDLPFAPPR